VRVEQMAEVDVDVERQVKVKRNGSSSLLSGVKIARPTNKMILEFCCKL
jgi:hypothetical protein